MVSRSQRVCCLCEFPAADGGVHVADVDAEKWAEWCRRELDVEKIGGVEEAEQSLVCQFCIWEARLAYDNGSDDDFSGSTACDWWSGHDDNHLYHEYFYKKQLIQPCKIVLEKIFISDSGGHKDLLATTAVLNASLICLQDKLGLQLNRGPYQGEIDCNLKSANKMFPCTLCKMIYNHHNSLYNHVKRTHKNAIKCKRYKCATYFLTDFERERHEEKIHLREGSDKCLKCIFCGYLTLGDVKKLNKHVKKKHKDAIKCDFDNHNHCPKYFHTEAEKNKHILEVHNKVDLDPKQCIYCGKSFKNKYTLTMHVNNIHANIRIKCRFRGCLEYFFNQKDSEDHFLKKHQHAQSLKKFKCPKCSFRTSRTDVRRNHLLRFHTTEGSFKCPQCPRSFYVKKQLTQHLKMVHRERCTCEHCGKKMQKGSMQLHFLVSHAILS